MQPTSDEATDDAAGREAGAGEPGAGEAAAERDRLLAALPAEAHALLARFEAAVRAEERRRLAIEFAELRATPPGSPSLGAMGGAMGDPTLDHALGAALAAEAADGPLAYCGPEEMVRLLVASFDEEDEA